MGGPSRPEALEQYVDDELLRAPLILDQLLDGVLADARAQRTAAGPAERLALDELLRDVPRHWGALGRRYVDALHEQLYPQPAAAPAASGGTRTRQVLELVDEDAIALDVELSRTTDAVKDRAEVELRDLQAYLAAMVGDMEIADEHNPLHPGVHARALRAAVQLLPLDVRRQCRFIRLATPPYALLLRQVYAAACARLAEQGIEPAAYRTVLMPNGSRRLQLLRDVTYVPDLKRLRDALPTPEWRSRSRERLHRLAAGPAAGGAAPGAAGTAAAASAGAPTTRSGASAASTSGGLSTLSRPSMLDAPASRGGPASTLGARAAAAASAMDRQSVELVHRLFKAFAADERIPADVLALVGRLRGPAMRLTLRDPSVLDEREHPLWSLIHLFAYHAEMVPDTEDPERQRWLAFGAEQIDGLAAETTPDAAAYQAAVQRLEAFVAERLAERCAALAPQLEALRRTEAGLAARMAAGAASDDAALDTVPAALLPHGTPAPRSAEQAQVEAAAWLDGLVPGKWLRLLLKGRWVHAQLLWAGERGRIVLLGDGATTATWALRRPVLLTLHRHGLAKTLKLRTLVGAAALHVKEQLSLPEAA
jgi:hypothetical protein